MNGDQDKIWTYIIKKTYLTEKAAFRADVVQEKQLT